MLLQRPHMAASASARACPCKPSMRPPHCTPDALASSAWISGYCHGQKSTPAQSASAHRAQNKWQPGSMHRAAHAARTSLWSKHAAVQHKGQCWTLEKRTSAARDVGDAGRQGSRVQYKERDSAGVGCWVGRGKVLALSGACIGLACPAGAKSAPAGGAGPWSRYAPAEWECLKCIPYQGFKRSGVPCRPQGRTSRRSGAALVLQVRTGPLPHGALCGRVFAGVHRRVARRRAEPARRPRLAPPLALLAGTSLQPLGTRPACYFP